MAPTHEWTVDAAPAGAQPLSVRATFLKQTYGHLLGAVMAFIIAELLLFKMGWALPIAKVFVGGKSWLLVLGGFILVSWLASRFAATSSSRGVQYLALFGFVAAEALLFVPILLYATVKAPGAIESAGLITVLGFAGLTAVVLLGKGDFSFLGSLLKWVGVVALLAIVGAVVFDFQLGMWFSVAMVALAGAAILYDTSNVLHHYPADRYVSAALALFASVAMMFFYVLRIVLDRR
jgi:FtsH-binding integral membrane protein